MARNLDRVGGVAQAAANAGALINRRNIRFLDGGGLTWTATDDPGNDEVEVTASAGGAGVPIGTVVAYGGTSLPSGWVECDGTAYGRTGGDPSPQVALFAAIGTAWGPGDGFTTFNVPTLARRTLVGRGGAGTGTLGNVVGNIGGAETHVLSTAELASHGHGYTAPNAIWLIQNGVDQFATTTGTGSTTDPAGGNGAHNNMQPSAIVMMIIKT
jgi:microcystin-dependent protein